MALDSSLAKEDRNRLENLGIFSAVTWNTVPLEDGTAILNFRVIESISMVPIFSPVYDENMGWFLILGTRLNNFRGRNEKLTLRGMFGNVSAYDVIFKNPWVFGDHVSLALILVRKYSNIIFYPTGNKRRCLKLILGDILDMRDD